MHTHAFACFYFAPTLPVQPHSPKFNTVPTKLGNTQCSESGHQILEKKRRDLMKMLTRPRTPPLQTCHIRWGMKYHLGGRKVNQTTRGREGVWSAPDHLSKAYLVFRAERTAKPSVTFSNDSQSVFVSAGGTSLEKCTGGKSAESAYSAGSIAENNWRGRLGGFVLFFFPPPCEEKGPYPPPSA